MAATLTAIREGIAANLAALDGVQVSAYMLASPTLPGIQVFPASIEYDLAMRRGLDKWMLTVRAYVGLSTDQGAQMKLDQYLAPSGVLSVKQAIESDSTLGGTVGDVQVVSSGGYQVYARQDGDPVLGAEWTVEVLATGT
jgi:hypothetical protein